MVIDACDFEELGHVCAALACDRATRDRVVLTRGDPVRAAKASSAIPRLFPPVEIEGRQLVDGALVDLVPVNSARELGANYVVAVSVLERRRRPARRFRAGGTWAASRRSRRAADESADRLIRPAIGRSSVWDFGRASELVSLGEAATERALPAIQADLEWRQEHLAASAVSRG